MLLNSQILRQCFETVENNVGVIFTSKTGFASSYFEIIEFWNYLQCTCMYEYTREYIFRLLPLFPDGDNGQILNYQHKSVSVTLVIDCCLTTIEQFFSYIMERTCYIQSNDNTRSVPNQHT